MRISFLLTLSALVMGSSAAFAADPLPSTCGTSGTDLCVDDDGDGYYTDPGAASVPAEMDCKDDKSWVFPGARPTLRDGEDSDCDSTGDADEETAAIDAARALATANAVKGIKDPTSPVAVALAEAAAETAEESLTVQMDRCSNGGWWANEEAHGMWGWSSAAAPAKPTCFGFDETEFSFQAGVKGDGYQSRADRRALARAAAAEKKADAAGLAADSVQESFDTLSLLVGSKSSVDAEGKPVDGTGLAGEVERHDGRLDQIEFTLDGDGTNRAPGLKKKVQAQTDILVGKNGTEDVPDADSVLGRLDALESSAPLFEVSVFASVLGGRPQYESKGGEEVRGAVGVGGGAAVTTGYGWDGRQLYLDLGFGQGSRSSKSQTAPLTVGYAAVGQQWIFGDLAVGPEAVILGNAVGNPLAATVSGWGIGAGVKVTGYVTSPDNHTRVGAVGRLAVVAESFGTNNDWDTGPGALLTFGLLAGRGPTR